MLICGCSKPNYVSDSLEHYLNSDGSSIHTPNTSISSLNSNEEFSESDNLKETTVEKTLNNITLNPGLYSDVSYRNTKEQSKKLYSVGIEGVTELISIVESKKYSGHFETFLLSGIYSILRVDEFKMIALKYADISGTDAFKTFLTHSQTEIPQIINSNTSTPEKISKLKNYGILCIPFLIDSKVDLSEYKELFISLGLHMETYEWMEHLIVAEDDEWNKSEAFLKNSNGFNYEKWIKENYNSLMDLQKHINTITES